MKQFDTKAFAKAVKAAHLKEQVKCEMTLSNKSIAEQIGIARVTLQRILSGAMPETETLLLLCDWMGINPLDFWVAKKGGRK